MKKVILSALVLASIIACNNTKKTEAKAAQKVENTTTAQTKHFSKIAPESALTWRATHLGGLEPRFGKVFLKNATFSVTNNALTAAKAVIDITSLTVENFEKGAPQANKLRAHLLNEDFFNTPVHPSATFELTNSTVHTGEYNTKITGNLTILGVTKSISFLANVTAINDKVQLVSEKFSIDRSDWGLTYNAEGTAGVPANYIISDGVEFSMNISMQK